MNLVYKRLDTKAQLGEPVSIFKKPSHIPFNRVAEEDRLTKYNSSQPPQIIVQDCKLYH